MPRVPPRFRIAPTPSGYLHLGNGVNFALTAALAQTQEAHLALRVDDLDAARTREAYRADIRETIAWLFPPSLAKPLLATGVSQSSRLDRYAVVLEGLRQNRLVFACSCSRRELAAAREASGADVNDYPGTCAERGLDLDAPDVAWRMRGSGVVVRQKDARPSYQLASLTDDVDAGTTHLVRGEDLRGSTAIQRVLAQALTAPLPVATPQGWPDFARFGDVRSYHHDLLLGDGGEKLSKSAGAQSLRALRASTAGPSAVFAKAAQLLGHSGVTDLPGLTYVLGQRPVTWD